MPVVLALELTTADEPLLDFQDRIRSWIIANWKPTKSRRPDDHDSGSPDGYTDVSTYGIVGNYDDTRVTSVFIRKARTDAAWQPLLRGVERRVAWGSWGRFNVAAHMSFEWAPWARSDVSPWKRPERAPNESPYRLGFPLWEPGTYELKAETTLELPPPTSRDASDPKNQFVIETNLVDVVVGSVPGPDQEAFREILDRWLFTRVEPSLVHVNVLWNATEVLAEGAETAERRRRLLGFLERHSRSVYGPYALRELLCYGSGTKGEDCLALLQRFLPDMPRFATQPWPLFQLAQLHEQAGRYAEAIEHYRRIESLHRQTRAAVRARAFREDLERRAGGGELRPLESLRDPRNPPNWKEPGYP